MTQQGNTMTDKTYTVAGTSTYKLETKVRFANDLPSRVRTLHKNGHEDIRMITLPRAMTKTEACRELYKDDRFQTDECQAAIENWVVNRGDTREFVKQNAESEPKLVNTYTAEEFEPDF